MIDVAVAERQRTAAANTHRPAAVFQRLPGPSTFEGVWHSKPATYK